MKNRMTYIYFGKQLKLIAPCGNCLLTGRILNHVDDYEILLELNKLSKRVKENIKRNLRIFVVYE